MRTTTSSWCACSKVRVYFITDISRQMSIPTQLEFMAVSSYGNATSSSGVVRILKDLDRYPWRNVVIIEDVIDSGLTRCTGSSRT